MGTMLCQAKVGVAMPAERELLGIPNPVWQLLISRPLPSQKFLCSILPSLGNCRLLFNPAAGHLKQNVTLSFLFALSGLGQTPSQQRQFWNNLFTYTGYTCILLTSPVVIQVMFTRADCTDSPIQFPKIAGAKLGLISHTKSGKKLKIIRLPNNHYINTGMANMDWKTYNNHAQI